MSSPNLKERVTIALLRGLLYWKSSPGRVRRYLGRVVSNGEKAQSGVGKALPSAGSVSANTELASPSAGPVAPCAGTVPPSTGSAAPSARSRPLGPGQALSTSGRLALPPGQVRPCLDQAGGEGERLRVAAVQMRLELTKSAEDFAAKVSTLTRQAVEQGAQLVAFPEDSGTGLLGLIPGIEEMAAGANLGGGGDIGGGIQVKDVFGLVAPYVERVYAATFSELARRWGIYIATGSAILLRDREARDNQIVNRAYFFGPDGKLLGSQDKCHLFPMECGWGLTPGNDIKVFSTPWGKVAIPICMDATYFETFRIASLLGADIVIIPSANPSTYNFWLELRGMWPRVQESEVYGINSFMVGEFLGLTLAGKSGIFAPMELTPGGDGVLARASSPTEETVVVADLDLAALRQYRTQSGLSAGFNQALYERYFPDLYRAYLERRTSRGA